ncbi:hypothetical protein D1007_08275 [Hordeum vulgare]|nr:hypothetical protein D1007_08275 [Hordeum vulgare]
MEVCRPQATTVVDVEACVKATAVLRECFAGNPKAFKHQYLRRIDEGLDQDTNPSQRQIYKDEKAVFSFVDFKPKIGGWILSDCLL